MLSQNKSINYSDKITLHSSTLINSFLIIGYEIDKLTQDLYQIFLNSNNISTASNLVYNNSNPPTLIDHISSNYSSNNFNEDDIIISVFPYIPKIYFNQKGYGPTYSVIFKINNNNIIFYGYAYIFYENITLKNGIVSNIPKAFCIISEYPFFTVYKLFCKQILANFSKENVIFPSEILVYNLVNYIPSPTNSHILLDFFPDYSSLKSFNFPKEIDIPQILSYPTINYRIIELFKVISPNCFVILFVLYFLELPICFLSKNIEFLNVLLYTLTSLEYPFNREGQEIKPTAKRNDKKDEIYQITLGDNIENSRISFLNTNESHFEVDIEKGEIQYILDKNAKNFSSDKERQNILLNLKNLLIKKKKGATLFEKCLVILSFELDKKIKEYSLNNENPSQKYNFFVINQEAISINLKIQYLFYKFIIRIFSDFKFSITKPENTPTVPYCIQYINSQKDKSPLLEALKSTKKFENFIISKMQKFEITSDNISLTYFDEFLNLYIQDHRLHLNYFDYLTNCVKQKIKKIDFTSFYTKFSSDLQNLINDEMFSSSYFISYQISNDNSLGFQYKYFQFDSNILFKYLHYLNYLASNNLYVLFPSLSSIEKVDYLESEPNYSLIIQQIEKRMVSQKLIPIKDLVVYVSLYLVGLLSKDIGFREGIEYIKTKISSIQFFCKKYILFLLIVISKNIENNEFFTDEKEREIYEKELYDILLNIVITKSIIPNKQMEYYFKSLHNYQFIKKSQNLIQKKEIHKISINLEILGNFQKISEKKMSTLMKMLENSMKDEVFFCTSSGTQSKICPFIQMSINSNKYISVIFTPMKLYCECMNLINEVENNCIDNLGNKAEELSQLIINLVFYLKNTGEDSKELMNMLGNYLLSIHQKNANSAS